MTQHATSAKNHIIGPNGEGIDIHTVGSPKDNLDGATEKLGERTIYVGFLQLRIRIQVNGQSDWDSPMYTVPSCHWAFTVLLGRVMVKSSKFRLKAPTCMAGCVALV